MNGIHDMGGMHGFGPVVREEHEPVFHEPWEGRVYAVNGALRPVLRGGSGGVGGLRDVIEQMPPADYLNAGYYERWLHQLTQRAIDNGLLSAEELDARVRQYQAHPGTPATVRKNPEARAAAIKRLFTPLHPEVPVGEPLYQLRQAVVARNLNWDGHNRLPRYIRGKRGAIERVNGWYRIEDAHPDRFARNPQPVYGSTATVAAEV